MAALTFPISVFESHVTINERYLFQKIVAMGKQVLNPLIMIPLLLIGYRSVTLTIVSLIFTVLSGVINITYCLTRLKMPFAFRHYDFALLREMFGFTLYVFIGIVVDNINWSIDRAAADVVPRLRRGDGLRHRLAAEQLFPAVRQRHLQRDDAPRPPSGGG